MALNYTLQDSMDAIESTPRETRMIQKHDPTLYEVATRDPLDPAPLLQGFAHYEPAISEMEDEARAVTVKDDATSAQCAEMAGQTRKLFNEIEKARKAAVEPYNSVVKMVNGSVKDFTDRLTMLQKLLEGKNRAYMIEQDRIRREALAAAERESQRVRKEAETRAMEEANRAAKKAEEAGLSLSAEEFMRPVFVPAVYMPPPKTDGLEEITVWEVVSWKDLPEEYFSDLNPKSHDENFKKISAFPHVRIGKMVAAGITNIPGVVFTKTHKVKTRAGR